jgi:TolB-like protein/Flp pilus assembly protein TadD
MSQRPNFFDELKRRHVYRVAVAYAVVGWLLIQVVATVAPQLNLPEWSPKLITLIILVTFPVALILAWAFELTPEGIRRTEPVHSPEARSLEVTRRVGKQLNAIIIAVMALVIVLLLAELFVVHKAPADSAPAASAASGKSAPAAGAPAKSIAVLPFDNLSDDKSNGYFATGMQDEILTRLSGIHDIKVISRTSTEKYASHPPDLKTVGRELDVATVLEGSVQKAGDSVHINVQLIDTANDGHLWAQSYDRDLKDIFAVERDVAQNIADALKAQLRPQEAAQVAAVPTTNPAAYDLYLRAMEHYNRAHDQDVLTATEMPQAIAMFEQALGVDPQFALAAAKIADAHMRMYFNAPDRTETRLAAAKAAADRALALQPGLGEAHLALAEYYYWGHRDYAAATEQAQLAQQSLPNSADVAGAIAAIARRQGRFDDSLAGFQRAALFDPRSSYGLDQLGLTYQMLRRYADADQAFSQSVAVAPDPSDERVTHGLNSALWKGDLEPLRAALQALAPDSDAYAGNALSRFNLAWLSHDYPAAIGVAQAGRDAAWADSNNIVLSRELYLAFAHEAAGEAAKAKQAYSNVEAAVGAMLAKQPDSAESHLALGFAEAGLGRRDDALREGRRAAELMPVSRDVISGPGMQVWLAQLEARVGEKDAAFERLQQVIGLPSGGAISPALLKIDAVWDSLRSDPRFDALLKQGEREVRTTPQG